MSATRSPSQHPTATGGFTPAPGTNYTQGSEPILAARLNALGKALGLHLTGLSGYRTPQHSVEVGGFANDPHTRGLASDTPGVEGVPESTLNKYGLTRPFGGASEADHIQLSSHAPTASLPLSAYPIDPKIAAGSPDVAAGGVAAIGPQVNAELSLAQKAANLIFGSIAGVFGKAFLYFILVASGGALVVMGVARAAGVKPSGLAKVAAK